LLLIVARYPPARPGDVSDAKVVKEVVAAANPTAIIHLAGLQIPTCRANPRLGAMVNVIGTINVFEAALAQKAAGGEAPVVVYASSAAVLGPKTDYPAEDVRFRACLIPRLPGCYPACLPVKYPGCLLPRLLCNFQVLPVVPDFLGVC